MAGLCDEFLGFQPLWFSHHDTEKNKAKEMKKGEEGAREEWGKNKEKEKKEGRGGKYKTGH